MKYDFTCKRCRNTFECESTTNKRRYCDECLDFITRLRNRLNQKAWRQRQADKQAKGNRK